ncbi:glycosyltransferase family 2 protein [Paramagnetospirillum magneticum]|uniref:glycosyltransferase family 2 protein n=1 Tax=Paramagnetospirillum magneticum TaxID=84159 RepID=UPI000682466A|nr:glycosyltransferase family 2 protein [Paramagnetospirillum magneticum]
MSSYEGQAREDSGESFELVSVIVPGYNEADSIEELYRRVGAALDGIGQPFEFIYVDDGSTDNSLEIIEKLRKTKRNIRVISHYINHGKSLALMQGFDAACGDVAVTIDADLQDLPEEIPALLAELRRGFDLANGWRINRRDTFAKRQVSRFYNALTNRFLKCSVHDINCGLKAMRRDVYKSLQLRGDLHRLIPALAAGTGFAVSEVKVDHADRKYGSSKYRLLRHRGLLDIIVVAASQAGRTRPFHVFFELGITIFAIVGLPSLIAWLLVQFVAEPGGAWARVWSTGTLLLFAWSLCVATMLPIIGFVMDINTARYQDYDWRRKLLRPGKADPAGEP